MKFHHNMSVASQWVQPYRLYHHIHMVPGHALPVIVLLLILSGDIETNPGPVGECDSVCIHELGS